MKIVPAITILIFLATLSWAQKTEQINVEAVHTAIEDSVEMFLLDVRTISEFDGPLGHIRGSVLIPLNELKDRLPELEEARKKKIIVICLSGIRSGIATQILKQNGFNAVNMAGGMLAWNKKYPRDHKVGMAAEDTVK